MEHERIPFVELAKMERGEIPMTEEGKLEIDKWDTLVKPPMMIPVPGSERTPVVPTILKPRLMKMSAGSTHTIRKSVFEIGLPPISVIPKVGSSVVYISPFRAYQEPFYEKIKYVSIRINEIKEISKEVYKNEKKFYKKEYGIKIPYEQFWDLYIKKHGSRSIPDVLANSDYDTIACDYAEFVGARIKKLRVIVKDSGQVTVVRANLQDSLEQLLKLNNSLDMNSVSFEVRNNYEKARHDVAYLKRLDEYDLNRVSEYAQEQWMSCVQHAINMMNISPGLMYPEQYRDGREVEYLLERQWNAQECKAVINEIERIRTGTRPSETQTFIVEPPKLANQPLSPDEMGQVVREILAPLGGYNLQGELIMSEADFSRLIEYTDYLVAHNKPPVNLKIIPQLNIAGRHITYTFRRIHDRLFTTKSIRDSFILFLMACFQEFGDREFGSFKTEFSKKPLKSYWDDLGLVEPK